MKRVIIRNKQGSQTHGAEMLDPSAWIEEGKAANWWGRGERWVFAEDLERMGEDQSQAIAVDVLTDLDEPDESRRTKTRYQFAADYTIEIEDLTAEIEAKKAKREAKKARRALLKAAKGKDLTAAETREIVKLLIHELIDDEI